MIRGESLVNLIELWIAHERSAGCDSRSGNEKTVRTQPIVHEKAEAIPLNGGYSI